MAAKSVIHLLCVLCLLVLCHGSPTAFSEPANPFQHNLERRRIPADGFYNIPKGEQLTRIKSAVNMVVPQLASYILGADDETFDAVYDKYFLPQHKDIVKQVFRNTANEELWKDIFIMGDDHQQLCATGYKGQPVLSYTTLKSEGGCLLDSQMHFCTSPWSAFDLPGVQDIQCPDFMPDLKMSKKMASFDGWLAFHEFMHLREITESVLGDIHPPFGSIVDIVYGPVSVRNLRKDDSEAAYAILNADSYALFAVELYFTRICAGTLHKNGLKYFKDPDSDQWTDHGNPSHTEIYHMVYGAVETGVSPVGQIWLDPAAPLSDASISQPFRPMTNISGMQPELKYYLMAAIAATIQERACRSICEN